MSKVLVTGGCGFIGSNIVNRLLKDNHEVIVFDNFLTGDVTNDKAQYYDVDISNADFADDDNIIEILNGVDVVFHFQCK